jgi:Fe(3+) dicitrate transport protein
VPSYTVVDFAGDYYLTHRVRLIGGVSNLGDERYYNRVFQNGIEPGLGRSVYASPSGSRLGNTGRDFAATIP